MNYYELTPSHNTFQSVVADLTHRCNMDCANCYIPNRSVPDMDAAKLMDAVRCLPTRTEIRLIGAEPTLRKDLPDIISDIRVAGHVPTVTTNGLRLRSKMYTQALKAAGLKSLGISMNGADEDSVYLVTDTMACASRKLAGLENAFLAGLFVNVNCILQRGVNDHTPQRLFNLIKSYDKRAVIRFKNVGQLGRFSLQHNENHTMANLIEMVSDATGVPHNVIDASSIVEDHVEENARMFKVPDSKIWIKITDWSPSTSSIPDPGSTRRGRFTQDFKIAPFFEHVKANAGGY